MHSKKRYIFNLCLTFAAFLATNHVLSASAIKGTNPPKAGVNVQIQLPEGFSTPTNERIIKFKERQDLASRKKRTQKTDNSAGAAVRHEKGASDNIASLLEKNTAHMKAIDRAINDDAQVLANTDKTLITNRIAIEESLRNKKQTLLYELEFQNDLLNEQSDNTPRENRVAYASIEQNMVATQHKMNVIKNEMQSDLKEYVQDLTLLEKSLKRDKANKNDPQDIDNELHTIEGKKMEATIHLLHSDYAEHMESIKNFEDQQNYRKQFSKTINALVHNSSESNMKAKCGAIIALGVISATLFTGALIRFYQHYKSKAQQPIKENTDAT